MMGDFKCALEWKGLFGLTDGCSLARISQFEQRLCARGGKYVWCESVHDVGVYI